MRIYLALLFVLFFTTSASAVTYCHDFTWWKLTNTDNNNIGVDELMKRLRHPSKKYRSIFKFMSSDAAKLTKAQQMLRAGDVIFLGQSYAHSGVMTPQGIDHYLQVPGEHARVRVPPNFPGPTGDLNRGPNGGRFQDETLANMLTRGSGNNNGPKQVDIWSNTNDLKVTITWNTRTDVDLWVEEPNNQKCWYQNRTTTNGGVLEQDVTTGFGPEHYALPRAEQGSYVVKVNYYSGPRNAKVEPTTVTILVTQFENTPNARTQTFTKVLNNRGETQTVHTVSFP